MQTWGNPAFREGEADAGNTMPMHEKDSYEMWKVEECSELQVSRYCTEGERRTGTFFFRKKK